MTRSRWLWPSSHSTFLRNPLYEEVDFKTANAHCDEVLIPDSDDELDNDHRRAKRRRVNRLAKGYLAGQGLFIPSASLIGPFGEPNDENYPVEDIILCQDAENHIQSPVVEGRSAYCAEQSTDKPKNSRPAYVHDAPKLSPRARRHALPQPATAQVLDGTLTQLRSPPSSPSSAIQDLLAIEIENDIESANEAEHLETSPCTLTLRGIENAKALSQAAIQTHLTVMNGVQEAKRLSQAAITDAETSQPPSSQPGEVRKSEIHSLTAPPVLSSKPKLLDGAAGPSNEAVKNASSPFKFRYKNSRSKQSRALTPPANENDTAITDVTTPGTADIYDVPDDDNEDSFATYTNKKLGKNNTRQFLKDKLRTSMRQSGATFEHDDAYPPTPDLRSAKARIGPHGVAQLEEYTLLERAKSPSQVLLDGKATRDTVPARNPAMQMSTQAALHAAHLDLLKSSPDASLLSPQQKGRRPVSADISHSPAPAVTPFAKFHERLAGNLEVTQEPQISTQAMLDAFSPFAISPEKLPESPRPVPLPPSLLTARHTCNFTPINKELQDPLEMELTEVGLTTKERATESSAPRADAAWSFDALDASPVKASCPRIEDGEEIAARKVAGASSNSLGFKVTKAGSQSQSKSSTQSSQAKAVDAGVSPPNTIPDQAMQNSPDSVGGFVHEQPLPVGVSGTGDSTCPRVRKRKSGSRKSDTARTSQSTPAQLPASSSQPAQSGPVMDKSDVNRSFTTSKPQSFSLVDIMADVSSSHPHIDFNKVLSQASVNSLNAGRHSMPSQKRGSVMDWYVEGEAVDDDIPAEHNGVAVEAEASDASRVLDSMALPSQRPPISSTYSFAIPSIPASKARLGFDSQSQQRKDFSVVANETSLRHASKKGGLKSSMKKNRRRHSVQDAQQEDSLLGLDMDMDIDTNLNELKNDVLGGWNVEEEARGL